MTDTDDAFEAKLEEAAYIDMFDENGDAEKVYWMGTMDVDGRIIAVLEYPDDSIGFSVYALDEDAIESFTPLPEDEPALFFKCCAQFEALNAEEA